MSDHAAESPSEPVTPRRVWVLSGDKIGDNAQLRRVAAAIAPDFQEISLRYRATWRLPNWILGASFSTLSSGVEELKSPWPDLVLASGRRSAPVARAIRRRSKGKTKLVHFGRPRADLDAFDLVVSTPQYRLPPHPKLLELRLPLSTVDPKSLRRAALEWGDRLAAVRRPRRALLVGGDSKPFRLDADAAAELGRQVHELCERDGGSLLVTCGRRVRPAAVKALREATAAHCSFFHIFEPGESENPYRAFLALAEEFIVTNDSVSMMADALATGRPMRLFEVPLAPTWAARLRAGSESAARVVFSESWRRRAVARGLFVPQRRAVDVGRSLVASGAAKKLGEDVASKKIIDDEAVLVAIMHRIEALFA